MHSQPLISVCIPAYNNAKFIALTLESVLQQTCHNFEIILTDDQSTDATVSVVKTFADPRIRLIQNEANLGIGKNWNQALSFAAGKYVKLLCADDLIYPDCLARQVDALEHPSNSGAVLAVCNSNVVNADNQVVFRRKSRFGPGLVSGVTLVRSCVRWGTNLIGEPAVGLFRRDVLGKSGLFDPENPYVLDLAFWAELLKHGDAFLDHERMAAFRISGGSVSTAIGRRQAAYFRRFIQKMRADPAYPISRLDAVRGSAVSFVWCILRNLLTKLPSRGKGSAS